MAEGSYSTTALRGVLHPSQDRRPELRYLNTIIEEADLSDTSPTRPSQMAPNYKQQLQQHQRRLAFAQQQLQPSEQTQQAQHAQITIVQRPQQHTQYQMQPGEHETRGLLFDDRLMEPDDQLDDIAEQHIEMWISPMSDHFPTPRGRHYLSAPIMPSSPSAASAEPDGTDATDAADVTDIVNDDNESSPANSFSLSPASSWNQNGTASTDGTEFDDIYDASDGEASASRKRILRASGISRQQVNPRRSSRCLSANMDVSAHRRMLPQLSIPVHSVAAAAAVIDADPKSCTSPMAPTPSNQVPMSPAIMSFMQQHHALDVPAVSRPPSLDGSMTSDQMSQLSAQISSPPTPVIGSEDAANTNTWAGVQLQPGALATLHSLARSDAGSFHDDANAEPDRLIEIPSDEPEPAVEMLESHPQQSLRLITSSLARNAVSHSPAHQRSLSGLTRLEIPSPGGFFSGLSPRTRHTWHLPSMTPVDSAHPPTSGTAEQFYRLPWAELPRPPVPRLSSQPPVPLSGGDELSNLPVEQVIEVGLLVERDDPVTAFQIQQTPVTARHLPPTEPHEAVEPAEQVHAFLETGAAIESGFPEAAAAEPVGLIAEEVRIARPAVETGSPTEGMVATEIVGDYQAADAQKLQQIALSHLDRTELWLVAQRAYLNGIPDMTDAIDEARSPRPDKSEEPPAVPPKDKHVEALPAGCSYRALARKKTVRFLDGIKSPAKPRMLPSRLLHQESAYYRAFTECIVRSHAIDTFVHRLPRFEALQAQRLLLCSAHRNQLLGKYQLIVVPQSAKKRMSANVVRGDDDIKDDPDKLRADKEADARSQMALAMWHVAATRFLNGGRLIAAPVHKRLLRLSRISMGGPGGASRDRARILDLGGQTTCDWAWHAALQYPNTKVYSVTTKAIRQLSNANIRGPSNHRQVAVEKLAKLPFDDDQFDLVRASELYSILKFVGENGEDEWESCLRECYRVLKPGGYLEFTVLDSDIVNAGPLGNAKSVEFGFVLQTLGYDPSPTKMFLGRLERAGFINVRRAWLCLPVGPRPTSLTAAAVLRDSTGAIIPTVKLEAIVTGSTDNIAAVTGLVGSWSWERWLLRAEMEKTAGELRLADTVTAGPALHEAGKSLDGMHAIVQEGRTTGAAWRMLRGHTQKPRSDMGTINMVLDMGW